MTGRRAPDSVGKCSRGVTDAVVKDANWRANNACIDANIDRGEGAYLTPAEQVSLTIETVAPVIAEAVYRAGIEDARELVDALTHLRGLKLSSPSEQLYGISADAFGAVAVAHDRLAAALTDTEERF